MPTSRSASGSGRPFLYFLSMVAGVALCMAACGVAHATNGPGGADTLRWVNPNGGAWTDAANWSPANVPDNDNEVAVLGLFAGNQPYTVTLNQNLLAGGLKIEATYATLDVSHGKFQLDGVPINKGTVRLSGGTDMYINRPLFQNEGGVISIGEGGATIELRMPYNVAGTLDLFKGGKLYLDGGGLNLFCSSLLEGTIERRSGTGEVAVEYAVPQNTVIAPNTVVRVTGLMDLLAYGASLVNNGSVVVSGTFQGPAAGSGSSSLSGTGEMVLDEGRIITGNENTGVLVNEAGHTIRGCGRIEATLVNYGTIEVSCPSSAMYLSGPIENHGRILDPRGILWMNTSRTHITNVGTIEANGGIMWIDNGAAIDNRQGVLRAASPVEIGRGTSASVQGGVIEGAGTLHNQGTVTLQDVTLGVGTTFRTWPGAITHLTGSRITNLGTMQVQGALDLGTSTDYVQTGGATSVEGGSISAARGLQIQQGELRGYGTITGAVTSGATVSPDPTRGALTILGSYQQLAGGRLTVGLAGTGPGQTSLLDIHGGAALDGTMEVSAVGGYAPVPGHAYDVLNYGSVSGAFSSIEQDLAGSLDASPIYAVDGVDLEISGVTGIGEPIPPAVLRFAGRGGAQAAFVLELPRAADVTVRAYDVRGREVATLASGSRPAGVYRLALSGEPSGVYFARATVTIRGVTEILGARVVSLR